MNREQAKELHLLFFSFMGSFHKKILRRFRRENEFSPRLSKNQAKIIHILYQAERLTFTELSKMLDVEKGGLTPMIDQLEDLELVFREPDPDDRRKCFIMLSSKGKKEMDQMMERYRETLMNIFDDISDEELSQFISNLHGVVKFMERL